MLWLEAPGFERRVLVFVEDHLYHTTELLGVIDATRPDLLAHATVVALDRPGPDTEAGIADWLERFPSLQVVAAVPHAHDRLQMLTSSDLASAASAARAIARQLRPGGLLVQDVQLTTLPFVPADRWWESIYLSATVRGLFPDRPPTVRFLSNKRGYEATFGRDLLEAGFDPRDVMDKSALPETVVPTIAAWFDGAFPLEIAMADGGAPAHRPVAPVDAERAALAAAVDLFLWPVPQGAELSGRLLKAPVTLRPDSDEHETWRLLVEDRLTSGPGLPVVDVGRRIGPAQAERAELTNLAARHLHTLRSRLIDAAAIVTRDHAYQLRDGLTVGIVTKRRRV